MKKVSKTIGMVIGLPIIYLLISSFVISIYSSAKNISIAHITPEIYVITLIADMVMLILMFIMFLPTENGLIKRCKFKKVGIKNILYIIILGIGISIIGLFIAGILSKVIPSYKDVSNMILETHSSIIKLIIVIVLVPIFEEIFFRGVIFGFLKNNFSTIVAVVIQALVFAVMHFNIVQGVYTFILGVALGLIYIYSESILGCIVLHIVYNLFGVLIIPKVMQWFPSIGLGIILLGIICVIFSSIKIINKYNNILYNN